MPNHRVFHYVAAERVAEPAVAFCEFCAAVPAPRITAHLAEHLVPLYMMLFSFDLPSYSRIALIAILELLVTSKVFMHVLFASHPWMQRIIAVEAD